MFLPFVGVAAVLEISGVRVSIYVLELWRLSVCFHKAARLLPLISAAVGWFCIMLL